MVVYFPGVLQEHHSHGSLNVEQDHLLLVRELDLVNWLSGRMDFRDIFNIALTLAFLFILTKLMRTSGLKT